jgi:hypothetical protein
MTSSSLSHTAVALAAPGFWEKLVDRYATRFAARPTKVRAYRELVAAGVMEEMTAAYRSLRLRLAAPAVLRLNRSGGRRKTVYLFPSREDLFLKGVNATLQPLAHLHSPLCHSFQQGRGVRTAYAALREMVGIERLACLHVDVRDFFASIPPRRLLDSLPPQLAGDEPLSALLREMLRQDERGVLAGTPLAPLLSNIYLRPLDDMFHTLGTRYLRYADDIVVFCEATAVVENQRQIEAVLSDLDLEANPQKLRISGPGEAWEFLGLRHEHGRIDLAASTVSKMHHRVRRLARRARPHRAAARYVVRRLNRKLYGFGADVSAFTWSTWFFPLIQTDATLRRLDRDIQDQVRFAVTGRHERRNRGRVPYAALADAGYLPLVTAFRAYRRGPGDYESLLGRRLRPT